MLHAKFSSINNTKKKDNEKYNKQVFTVFTLQDSKILSPVKPSSRKQTIWLRELEICNNTAQSGP